MVCLVGNKKNRNTNTTLLKVLGRRKKQISCLATVHGLLCCHYKHSKQEEDRFIARRLVNKYNYLHLILHYHLFDFAT